MRVFRSLITALVLAVGFTVAVPAAFANDESTTTTTTTTTKHKYVYYGDHQIYYAPETRVYYWREGDTWRSGAELPPADVAYVKTGGVEVELDTDRPYERHTWVVAHLKNLKAHIRDDDEHGHDHD